MPARARRAVVGLGLVLPLALAGCTVEGSADAAGSSASASASASSSSSTGASGGAAAEDGAGGGAAGSGLALEQAYQRVIQQVLPSVVEIRTGSALGSGVVLDTAGNIVTNAHVVGTATQFQVQLAGSATPLPATLVGTYPTNDLAVIRVQGAKDLHPATLGDSTAVEVGTLVLAMGNPLGLSSSVTDGIVSAVGRTVSEPAEGTSPGAVLPSTIQTSAAINPGNSGGALVDLQGQVIGIPTLAATDPQTGGGTAPGLGFAIPSNTVEDIAGQLVRDGRVTDSNRAALDATVVTLADASGAPAGVGVVAVQPGGAAASAGLRTGDVITAVAGQQVASAQQLAAVLAGLQVGQQVDVTVRRDGATQQLQVTLGELQAG